MVKGRGQHFEDSADEIRDRELSGYAELWMSAWQETFAAADRDLETARPVSAGRVRNVEGKCRQDFQRQLGKTRCAEEVRSYQ